MDDLLHAQKILVLDYGSQYTQLIARRVRESGAYCEIHPWSMEAEEIQAFAPKGIILSGGHHSVYDDGAPGMNEAALAQQVPILGICYGMHLLARHFGGEVSPSATREYGHALLRATSKGREFPGGFLSRGEGRVWMSHGDHVTRVPFGFETLAMSDNGILAAMEHVELAILGVQFHPEVNHTEDGATFIQGFVRDICGCSGLWTAGNVIEHEIARAREKVGADRVILGLSGGVDSAVTAVLLHRALGDQLTCVFVDNGLLRLNEGEEVMATFARHLGVKVIRVDAEERFLSRLTGVSDPEQKRKIIGHTFIEVFEEEAKKIDGARWLAQGTIYPDVIESAGANTKAATNIKSHHNVGGLPERMGLKLLEPLRELFKDEVRSVGLELGLPARMILRHPFPGPGLGVRILGEVKKPYADLLRRADAIYLEELYNTGHYDKISQAFAVFLPVKSVGVMGDGRSYDYVVALRAVETRDFMTASWYPMPHDILSRIANRIINEVKGINRVVYDITSKPPGTIEWE
ncbi:GMP synthase [glutamine-hydrolyzing] [Candidatus Magnetaquicoccaceae bacterium FCR-1]|uniref:GMP synthase [glutamine-hydrolyzing] n=1 Tax=Candidatus Magnetaquiglobus chichijimensis TaxID=3141448 RepID=A0ABQ0C885_9PROT